MSGRGRGKGERISSRLCAYPTALRGAQSLDPEIATWAETKSQTLGLTELTDRVNWLSHPATHSSLCPSFQCSCRGVQGHSKCWCVCACVCMCVLIFLSRNYRIIFISRVLKFHNDLEFIFILWALWIWRFKPFTSVIFAWFFFFLINDFLALFSFWNSYCLDVGIPGSVFLIFPLQVSLSLFALLGKFL